MRAVTNSAAISAVTAGAGYTSASSRAQPVQRGAAVKSRSIGLCARAPSASVASTSRDQLIFSAVELMESAPCEERAVGRNVHAGIMRQALFPPRPVRHILRMMTGELRDRVQAVLGPGYRVDRELGGGGMSRV